MRKNNLLPMAKKTAKSVIALSLATAMAVPASAYLGGAKEVQAASVDAKEVTVPEPIKQYDFESGMKELAEDDTINIVKSNEVYFLKTADEISGTSDKLDANGLLYTGAGDDAKYYKNVLSNQPTSAYDSDKGTVLKLGNAVTIPEIKKTVSASLKDDDKGTAALDKLIPAGDGVVQGAYTANSGVKISNPFANADVDEYGEYYDLTKDNGGLVKYGDKYSPLWNKGLTISYWIKVPANEDGTYKRSSVLRWELNDQIYFQTDDYAKHLVCSGFDQEVSATSAEVTATYNESKVPNTSKYYFEYYDKEADGSPKMYIDPDGNRGPLYKKESIGQYYYGNPNFQTGFTMTTDGTVEKCNDQAYYDTYAYLPREITKAEFDAMTQEQKDKDNVKATEFGTKTHYMVIKNSQIRFAEVDGEFQIDDDNSTFFCADNCKGINENPNRTEFGNWGGMNNADCFFMNSWRESTGKDAHDNGDYAGSAYQAESPVTSMTSTTNKKGEEVLTPVKNGNVNTWQHVTMTLQNDWVEFYINGRCVNVREEYSCRGLQGLNSAGESFKRLNKGAGLRYGYGSEKQVGGIWAGNYVARLFMDWITDPEAVLCIGGAGQYAKDYAAAETTADISLDDLTFYGCLLDENQIKAAYEQSAAKKNAASNTTLASGNAVDLKAVTGSAADAVTNGTASITDAKGVAHSVSTLDVSENLKASTNNSAQLSNPFAGKSLEGATIGYWMKQDARSNATAGAKQATVGVSFFDAEKEVVNPKEPENNGDASSIIYGMTNGAACFTEGYSSSTVCQKLKNNFYTAPEAATGTALTAAADQWHYYTYTFTNAGINVYIDGKLIANDPANSAGPRFLDGFVQRLQDEADVTTRYGVFGATNNQGASTLMDVLTYADTAMYLGYLPAAGGTNNQTNPTSYASMISFDVALSAEQVKDLYENSFNPTPVDGTLGDADGNGSVELADANLILKAALKIETLTEAQKTVADIDKNGEIELADANAVLKEALKITTNFK